PADLARLSPRGVDALITSYLDCRGARGESVVGLVRCHEGTGTNAVLLDPKLAFTPEFGPDSFAAHQRAVGSRAVELQSDEVAFDVDTGEDLAKLASGFVPARLGAFVDGRGRIADAMSLIDTPLDRLVGWAAELRDEGHDQLVTYSRKVFLPLTHLCRDSCHYCTFAK